MRVTCPECEQKFDVPDKALGTAGRKLKCSNCGHQWFQEPTPQRPAVDQAPAEPEPAEEVAEEPAAADTDADEHAGVEADIDPAPGDDSPGDDLENPLDQDVGEEEPDPPPLGDVSGFRAFQAPTRRKASRPVALYILLALAFLIPAALFGARPALVRAWPASALLYDSVGLRVPVAGEGLVLQNVQVHRRQEGSVEVLVVAGEIRNPTETLVSLPSLRATVLAENGESVQSWLIAAGTSQLLPGEQTAFTSEFANTAPGAARVNVTFTEERPEAGLGY